MSRIPLFSFEIQVLSVSELNGMVRSVLESEYRLQDLWVSGEVSNLSIPSSGHMYFTLKDEEAVVRCVMWRPAVARLLVNPREGEQIEVHGSIGVYESGGRYQLYADKIRVSGKGELFQQFLALKRRLEEEGLFQAELKRKIPLFPTRIGVVTSPTAAALKDVINVLRRRYPLAELILSPANVQGDDAPQSIVRALKTLNQDANPDVILLVRGGGSMEDLSPFNDEGVVRAVAASMAPTITGIGHATDFILADFAADKRAPTPSAAAEIATPDREELAVDLQDSRKRLSQKFAEQLGKLRWELKDGKNALLRVSPAARIRNAKLQVDELHQRSLALVRHALELKAAEVLGLQQTLRVIGPRAVLERGFAYVRKKSDESLIRSRDDVEVHDRLVVEVQDGEFDVEVLRGEDDE
ncbi:MAG: exodeoxyribonuclease VII large subunit [Chloroflexi bacterium]|nr:exodeoxyribonuclease VII large subunit [Chloroflexota bacterium]